MKQPVTFGPVEPPKPYEMPVCPDCKTPFKLRKEDERSQEWIQDCKCEPDYLRNEGFNIIGGGNLKGRHRVKSFYGYKVGEAQLEHCLICHRPIQNGEIAAHGEVMPTIFGCAHTDCYERYSRETKERIETANAIAEKAKLGPSISIWFSADGETIVAPNTGHADNDARMLPAELPELPEECVVYEQLRRPFAMSYINFTNADEAHAWWERVIQNINAPIEIHWYDPGDKKKATKSWTGQNFANVKAKARYAEWQARSLNH